MQKFGDRASIINAVATENDVDPELIASLLALEAEHHNLRGYGARPALRRAAEKLIDGAIAKLQAATS